MNIPAGVPREAHRPAHETDAMVVLTLATQVVKSLDDSAASPAEKIAAMRTAAYALEQAISAQQLSTVMANYVEQSRPR